MRNVSLVWLLACIGCGPSTPGTEQADTPRDTTAARTDSAPAAADSTAVELRVDSTSYAAGGQVALTITNHSNTTVSFNPCTRIVERESGSAWVPVEEPNRVCTMEAWLLEPHATRNATTELPSPLEAGRYRLVILLTREGAGGTPASGADRLRAVSAPFTVR
jgi:hypothetical protein